jgi:hypothetical protein
VAKNSCFVYRSRWVGSGTQNLYGTVKPAVADELGTSVSEIIQRPNSELGARPSCKILGLLTVAVEGLISVEPGFVAMGPDGSDYTTDPTSAMVAGGRMDFLSLKVRRSGHRHAWSKSSMAHEQNGH